MLQSEVKELKCAQAENQVEPENAYVALEGSEFTIVPETEGSKLKVKEAYKALDTAISGSQTSIDLGNTPDVYAVAAVTSDDPTLQATRDAYNNYTKASITYTFGEQTVTLDGSTLKEWLQFDDKGQLVQDDASFTQHIKDFVAQLASEHDTVGTTRSFNTTSGRTVSVYGSAYGWKIDQDAEAAQLTEEIRTGTQTTREPVYSMRANSYGYNDIGSTYIEVDLSSQHMYYYQNGSIIFDSDIVSGDIRYDDRATPPGIFTLYYKKSRMCFVERRSRTALTSTKPRLPTGCRLTAESVSMTLPGRHISVVTAIPTPDPMDVSICRWMQQLLCTALLIPMCRSCASTKRSFI